MKISDRWSVNESLLSSAISSSNGAIKRKKMLSKNVLKIMWRSMIILRRKKNFFKLVHVYEATFKKWLMMKFFSEFNIEFKWGWAHHMKNAAPSEEAEEFIEFLSNATVKK